MKHWIVPAAATGGATALRLLQRPPVEPGPGQVKLRVRACATNFRDLMVASGRYPGGPLKRDTIPLSDGAGEVIAVGAGVTRWRAGDRVAGTFFQVWQDGPMQPGAHASDLGGSIDGMLAEEVVLGEQGLVRIPDSLGFEQAATLPCAALTAWHALFESHALRPGQSVLVLGTGGVSVFALQFAVMAGAQVIVTSSSDAKLERARALGATHAINYRKHPDWAAEVLRLTDGRGVDIVIEVGGPGTLAQSAQAVATGGTIALIGVLAAPGSGDFNPLVLLRKAASLRGVYVGSRAMFERMLVAITANGLQPVIDRSFGFEQAADAYLHQAAGGHFGKVVISVR